MASKFLFCSFLALFLLFSCFLEKGFSLKQRKYSNFHDVSLTSLFPDSVCSSSVQGSSNRPSTLKVLHRDGPCSKLSQDKTNTPALSEILSHDQSRVNFINSRLTVNTATTDKIRDKKANLPAQSGSSLGSGNYIVTVGLGTPKKDLSLIFDTGSDLTWTQCEPCARSCYKQQQPIFNPSQSTSYTNVSCASSQCSQLPSATGNNPSCSKSTCVYGIQYGDQSFSIGFFGKEKLSLTSTDVFPNFFFGCGQNNQGLFGNTAGLLGLGRDTLSVVSQTASKYGKYFSYCLPSRPSSIGHLTFGRGATSRGVKFTPFASSPKGGASFYFIDITAIRVGAKQLSISPSVFKNAGSIIDSGTVITRLPPTAYSAMSTAFKQQMTKYPSAPAYSILDTCYDFSNYTSLTIPKIAFTFSGNVEADLDASGILIAVSSSRACLAFAGNGDDTDVGIFGNTQQKTLEVVYDVAGEKLGFGASGCA